MDGLSELFGGISRIKIMRLFLAHETEIYSANEIVDLTKLRDTIVHDELKVLAMSGLIEKTTYVEEYQLELGEALPLNKKRPALKNKPQVKTSKELHGYMLSKSFLHLQPLRQLLFNFESISNTDLRSHFDHVCEMKYFVRAGVFVGSIQKRVDIFIVGEAINKKKADRAFFDLEALMGRELAYAIMDADEYRYRENMCDKFLEDIRVYPHEIVMDKLTGPINRLV